jgi:hypothetical protein
MTNGTGTWTCGVCGAASWPRFDAPTGVWWCCTDCGCLEVDPSGANPPSGPGGDSGAVQRAIARSIVLPVLLSPFGARADHRWLDLDDGTGLLCRLLRDRGFDCWHGDDRGGGVFTRGFDRADAIPGPWPIVTLFDRLDAMPDALDVLAPLDADVIFANTTRLAPKPGEAWTDAASLGAPRRILWSLEGLTHLARRLGARLVTNGTDHVFLREEAKALSPARGTPLELGRMLRDPEAVQAQGRPAFLGCLSGDPLARARADDAARAVGAPGPLLERKGPPRIQGTARWPRVVVDGVFHQHMLTGIGRYWDSVLEEWGRTEFGAGVTVLSRMGTAAPQPGIAQRIVDAHDFGQWDRQAALLDTVCAEVGADVFFSSYYTAPTQVPRVMVVYDMIPERLDQNLSDPEWVDKHRAIADATRHVCISETTRTDLCRMTGLDPGPIPIAYPGVDHDLFHRPDPEVAGRIARSLYLPDRYFLMVGSTESYKNGAALFRAMRGDPELARIPVIVACQQGALSETARAAAAGLTVLAHRFTDQELAITYARATAMVMPSLIEGFGMPVIEAAACGCPVVCSDIPVFREILGDAALFVDPADTEALRAALRQAMTPDHAREAAERGPERAARYTWRACAQELATLARAVARR